MNPELERIFDSVPDDEPRSRLEPYCELILRWRRQGRSYRRVRELLREKCNLTVAYATVYQFVRLRSRPRKTEPETDHQPSTLAPLPTEHAIPRSAPGPYSKLSPEEVARQRAIIQALRHKPVVVAEVRKRFVYDPDEPLTIDRTRKE